MTSSVVTGPLTVAPGAGDETWASEGTSWTRLENPFPIPSLTIDDTGKTRFSSARTRARVARRRRAREDVQSVFDSVNWLAGCKPACVEPKCSSLDQARLEAQAFRAVYRRLDGPAIPGQRSAFRELTRGRQLYSEDGGDINLASFSTIARVSLPKDLRDSPLLSAVLPAEANHFLENIELMLRPEHEIQSMEPPPKAHWDPVLRGSKRKLRGLYRHLILIGLVQIAPPGTAVEQLGKK